MATQFINRTPGVATRYVPVCRVSFHTATKCYQTIGVKLATADQTPDPTYQLLSAQTSKTLSDPAGTFSLQLAGNEWEGRLKSNDLVVIQMGYYQGNGQYQLDTVMVGLIDTVSANGEMSNTQPNVTTTVTGRDMAKVFLKGQLQLYPQIQGQAPTSNMFFLTQNGWSALMSLFQGQTAVKGTPAILLDTIMRYILPKLYNVQWTVWDETKNPPVPKTVSIEQVIRYQLAQTNFFLPFIMSLTDYEGALWNLMEQASVQPFTEIWIDTRSGTETYNTTGSGRMVNEAIEESSSANKASGAGAYPYPGVSFGSDDSQVTFVLRNTPFSKNSWNKLVKHTLHEEDIQGTPSIDISDNDNYNLFWAGSQMNPLVGDLSMVSPPMFNESNAMRYGLNPFQVTIQGLAYDQTKESDSINLINNTAYYTKLLKSWFESNSQYASGTMSVRGKGSYKVGQVLYRPGYITPIMGASGRNNGTEFYIEGVSQRFSVYSDWSTSLSLTRGMDNSFVPTDISFSPQSVTPPAPPVPPSQDKKPTAKYYTVKEDDTLWGIAYEEYKDGGQWVKIWNANKTMLIKRDPRNQGDPGHYIYAGQKLYIP